MSSPFECLPVELLIDIFLQSQVSKINQDQGPFAYVVEECQRPVINWVPLMLVCPYFRDVIIAAPTLWSRIHVTSNLAALQHGLSRFVSSPLDLVFGHSSEPIISLIESHAYRIRSIITSPRFHVNSLFGLVPVFKLLLPALEHVHIDPYVNFARESEEWHKLRDAGSVLNETLHPQVKMVTSYRLLLPAQESQLWTRDLVYLDIRCEGGPVTTEHRNDLLTILRKTRRLECLTITFSHGPPPELGAQILTGVQVPPPIRLPRDPSPLVRLRTLALCGPSWLSGPVLHGIDAPSLEKFHLKLTVTDEENEDAMVNVFPGRLRRFLSQNTALHIHAASGRDGFRIGDCYCETGRVTSDRFSVYVKGSWRTLAAHLHTALRLLCRVFEDTPMETLELNYFAGQSQEVHGAWRSVFKTFPALKKLTLFGNDWSSGTAMVDAIQALQREGLNPGMELMAQNTDW